MYVDADVLYAHLKPSDWLKKHAQHIIGKGLSTSAITITELEIVSKRDFGDEFSQSVAGNVLTIKNLEVISLNRQLLRKSAELRKKYKLSIFDAIHAATAIQDGGVIVSSDQMFDTVRELVRKDPREFLS